MYIEQFKIIAFVISFNFMLIFFILQIYGFYLLFFSKTNLCEVILPSTLLACSSISWAFTKFVLFPTVFTRLPISFCSKLITFRRLVDFIYIIFVFIPFFLLLLPGFQVLQEFNNLLQIRYFSI